MIAITKLIRRLRLPRFSLRARLFSSIFAIVTLFTLTNITYQISGENRNQRLDNLQKAVQGQLSSVTIRQDLKNVQKEILVLDALKEAGEPGLSSEEIELGISKLDALSNSISQLESYTYPESESAYEELSESFRALNNAWRDYYADYQQNNDSADTQQIESLYEKTIDILAKFESLEVVAADRQTRELQSLAIFANRVTLGIYLFTILLTVGLGFLLIRYTTRALRNLQRGVERIGRGNLDYHIPIKNNDEISDLTHAFNDMSDKLRNAMAQVQQSKEKADQANRAKTNFLANMSHELRTPLNAIIGYSEMNIDFFADENELDQKQTISDLHHILDSGRHLLQLINDVLDLAKIESGNMTVFNETFSSIDLLKDIITTMRPLAEKNNNRIVIEAEDELPPLYSDSIKFRQIFINLLSNACKFTKDGDITIKAKLDNRQNLLVFEVQDTGIGMTPEQLDNIFEAFVQAEHSTSKNYGGTGLGLAICKEFIELMQGTLDVKSAPDVGTSFIVSLPQRSSDRREQTVIPTSNQQELDLNEALEQSENHTSKAHKAILMRCSKEITNVFFLQAFQSSGFELLPLDNLSKQIHDLEDQKAKGCVIELCGATRKSFNQGWSDFGLLFQTTEPGRRNFIVAYHQFATNSKERKHETAVVKLPSLEFLNERVSQEIATQADIGKPQLLVQKLRHLNPVGRRGQAILLGFDSNELRHFGERLQIELSAEAWQCQSASTAHEICSRIESERIDLILMHPNLNDVELKPALNTWFLKNCDLKATHPDRSIRALIIDPDSITEQEKDTTTSARLLEKAAHEIVPIVESITD